MRELLQHYLEDSRVLQMKEFNQHNGVSTYQHCFNVAVMSLIIFKVFGLKGCIAEMLIGAILHDYYLYDWHDGRRTPHGIHGWSHPGVALKNASEDFDLTPKQENIIASHMFPLTITKYPKSKEAVVVSIADKICAVKEYLGDRVWPSRY